MQAKGIDKPVVASLAGDVRGRGGGGVPVRARHPGLRVLDRDPGRRCSAPSTSGRAARACCKPSGRVGPAVAKRRAGTHSAACRVRGSRIGLSGRPGRLGELGGHEHSSSKRKAQRRSVPAQRPPRLRPAEDARHAEGPAGRSAGARRGARAARRPAAPARPADRAPAPDPGPLRLPARAPSRGARRRDAAGAGRGLRGRLLLRPLRHRHGRRAGPAAAHGPGLRQPDLRHDGRRAPARRSCTARSEPSVRVVRAPCMGRCDNAPVAASAMRCTSMRRVESVAEAVAARRDAPARPGLHRLRRATGPSGGYKLLARVPRRQARRSRTSSRRSRIRTCAASAARASRPGASGASCAAEPGAAPDGRQRRRGRARHLQGPALPRDATRTASSKAC